MFPTATRARLREEKASFALAIPALYALGRVPAAWLAFASLDAAWLLLFAAAFQLTPKEPTPPGGRGRTDEDGVVRLVGMD